MSAELVVADRGKTISFRFEQLLEFHAGNSPAGVAHAFKVLQRALPILSPGEPTERREIAIRTAFGGPGARDAFECVTHAVAEGRYAVDPVLARPDRGRANERFVFELGYRGRLVTLAVRDGFVSEEFIDLARIEEPSAVQERRLDRMKQEMAERVMAAAAEEVYAVD